MPSCTVCKFYSILILNLRNFSINLRKNLAFLLFFFSVLSKTCPAGAWREPAIMVSSRVGLLPTVAPVEVAVLFSPPCCIYSWSHLSLLSSDLRTQVDILSGLSLSQHQGLGDTRSLPGDTSTLSKDTREAGCGIAMSGNVEYALASVLFLEATGYSGK